MKKYLYLGCVFGILTSGVFGKTTITITSDAVKFDYGVLGKSKEIKLNETSEIEGVDNCKIEFKIGNFGEEVRFDPTRLLDKELIIKNNTNCLLRLVGSFNGETAKFESEKFFNEANVLCDKKINIKSKKCVNCGDFIIGKNYAHVQFYKRSKDDNAIRNFFDNQSSDVNFINWGGISSWSSNLQNVKAINSAIWNVSNNNLHDKSQLIELHGVVNGNIYDGLNELNNDDRIQQTKAFIKPIAKREF